jgi:glycosidase
MYIFRIKRAWISWIGLLAIGMGMISPALPAARVYASDTPPPVSVTIVGDLQSELGCAGDWDPACANTHLTYDTNDAIWQDAWSVPAGNWQYKAALNDSWDENYGQNATRNGANITLNLGAATTVKFYYDHETHWITDNQNSIIATVPGSFQSELGCSGDWDPGCLRSWLQDPDGNGTYSFSTTAIPAGDYEAKVTINESWDENYGQGGLPAGANIPFSVSAGDMVSFVYDPVTHILTITATPPAPPGPASVTIAGSLQSELGCGSDWDPACALTHLGYDFEDDVWQNSFDIPAGSYEYKAALNDSWDENYGQNATPGGANIPLALATDSAVKFYYDHKTHWVTDDKNSVIATVPGSFQSELGCAGDWDPGCMRSWLQDPDGDGTYGFSTASLPAGSYEAKVAINESWDENYGQGGVQNGTNIPFTVPADGILMIFTYDPVTHILTIRTQDDVEWYGVKHDSRDLLYRTPGGAVPAGTPVTLRLRTFHDDVTSVKLRVYDLNNSGQTFYNMQIAAADVSCYEAGLENRTCDFWEVTLPNAEPNNLWYRFVVSDGSDTDYYADNTPALDGGVGAVTDDVVDNSFALTIYDPAFSAPSWASSAFIYQIFADRFKNGYPRNDPQTGDPRYDDPVLMLPWGTLPEGYCRNYADAATNCPWRFDDTPPDWSPTKEAPRGRDYFGGDLKGVEMKLPYLRDLGVTAIYFNPIFDAQSNHRYDTEDYYQIDPYLGNLQDFEKLVRKAEQFGIRIIVDGVFNHMSSDSPIFDRYRRYATSGACEDAESLYRGWFTFRPPGPSEPSPCEPSTPGGNDTYYNGWFGFDSIPVLQKSNPDVQAYFLFNPNSVSRFWTAKGIAGWRQDVMGDSSFPNGYWEAFRQIVKESNPNILIIGELWQKDSTLLRFLRGDRADTTMNYRLRDAVLGLLSPGNFDSKGFADSGRPITPSEFAARISSIREDYPDAAYYSLMNLLDSHDTERILWALTPGSDTTADKELNTANVAEGKQRQKIAALIQFTMPGAPTVYYGDEVGVTGDDDPDDRRTFPWIETGGKQDKNTLDYYKRLATFRRMMPALGKGDIKILLADDAADTVAYGRKTLGQAAVVVINRSAEPRLLEIPVSGYLPDGVKLFATYGVGSTSTKAATVSGGHLQVKLGPMSAWLFASFIVDLNPPKAPSGLTVTQEASEIISLSWNSVKGAVGYNLFRSPVSGGGWVRVNSTLLTTTSFTDSGLRNAQTYYYVVTALDRAGNESAYSNQVSAMPHYIIGWANLQWPPTMAHTISTTDRTDNAYGQVWIDGVTSQPGATDSLLAQLGFGPEGSNPADNLAWTWVDAHFNVDTGNNDEFAASMLPETVGAFDYLYRYSTTNGRDWLYADLNGPVPAGALPPNPGKLTVNSSGDTTPPAVPTGLQVVGASPDGVSLVWDEILGDPTLYGYEVRRSDVSGGPYTTLALVAGATSYTDTNVSQGATYYYVVRSVDTSFNRSADSAEVQATAQLRTVTVVFTVTVPATTDGIGRSVYIAGTLDRLDGGLPQWDPGGVVLTRVDATTWTITLTGLETTAIEYKYALGSWDYVEKDASCGEISNRILTLSYGATGVQNVNDTVLNWRNVSPCGN